MLVTVDTDHIDLVHNTEVLKPLGLLAVANNLFLKKYQDDHNLMNLFTKKEENRE